MNYSKDLIPTFTGRLVNPLALRPEDVCIEDIAHHLARVMRFTGATRGAHGYSVAQHSVAVSGLCPNNRLWGLLHDASEAYLNDVARPLKYSTKFGTGYKEYEMLAMHAICTRFGLVWPEPEEVKLADNTVLATEYRDLIANNRDTFHAEYMKMLPPPENRIITPWSPTVSEEAFLYNFYRITEGHTL